MKVNVRMLAFGRPAEVRVVSIPDKPYFPCPDAVLDEVYYWDQNDFQPLPHPSVSVGDVIELFGRFYLVKPVGFAELTAAELAAYEATPQRDRVLKAYDFKEPADAEAG